MALLCREFDISRKTGYKIFDRYKECGLVTLLARKGCRGAGEFFPQDRYLPNHNP